MRNLLGHLHYCTGGCAELLSTVCLSRAGWVLGGSLRTGSKLCLTWHLLTPGDLLAYVVTALTCSPQLVRGTLPKSSESVWEFGISQDQLGKLSQAYVAVRIMLLTV